MEPWESSGLQSKTATDQSKEGVLMMMKAMVMVMMVMLMVMMMSNAPVFVAAVLLHVDIVVQLAV